jgi:hypothetical protein
MSADSAPRIQIAMVISAHTSHQRTRLPPRPGYQLFALTKVLA